MREQRAGGLARAAADAALAPSLRRDAQLLNSANEQIPRGATRAIVVDYYDPALAERAIDLDPAAPLSQQIAALFRRAKKLEHAAGRAREAIDITKNECSALAAALETLGAAASPEDVTIFERDLAARGLLPAPREHERSPAQRKQSQQKRRESDVVRKFKSEDGYEILVGRGARENDVLTYRIARGNDLWVHVDGGASGSHVVVRVPPGGSAPLQTLLDAATLAVHFSKLRGRRHAGVLYTLAKYVKKPAGAATGLAHAAGESRLALDIDAARLVRLLSPPADCER